MGAAHLPADRVEAPKALTSTAVGAAAYVNDALSCPPTAGDALTVGKDVTVVRSVVAMRRTRAGEDAGKLPRA